MQQSNEVSPCNDVKIRNPPDETNILDLNDDCLLEIFKYLTVQETFDVLHKLGNRIDSIALKRIARLKSLSFSLRDPPEFTPYQLKVIGKTLKTLRVTVGYSLDTDKFISMYLNPLCFHGSIQDLTLNYVQFNDAYQHCVLRLAPHLQHLDLNFCQLTDELLQPIVEKCTRLETLSIIGNYEWKGKSLYHINSPNMKCITLELNDMCNDEVDAFKARRGQFPNRLHSQTLEENKDLPASAMFLLLIISQTERMMGKWCEPREITGCQEHVLGDVVHGDVEAA
ncbi:uncharacterized protein LOC133333836 [Musca vetustissima]|uniref:uncharacterized protein LOC133333836 n=1 Tax=Musca vetustissima TaxID=27455 RepID=UPI002AB7E56C|nr:uncharacterized protein LOC133333836 [Musca vetustissima]